MNLPRKLLVILLISLALAGIAYAYYTYQYIPAQAAPTPTVQTARARQGDIRITAVGNGSLVSATEVRLGFRTGGQLTGLAVAVGEPVEAGQVLARLDDTSASIQLQQAELNLAALTSPFAVAEAERALADAQEALANAEYARLSQQEGYRGSDATIDALKAKLILAEAKVKKAWEKYEPLSGRREDNLERASALASYSAAVQARDAVAADLSWYLGNPNEEDQASLDAAVANAQIRVEAAEALLAELKGQPQPAGGNLAINPDLNQLRQAKLALENARLAVQNSVLVAPMDGIVTSVGAAVGEVVSSAPIITLASVGNPVVRFYLEENDLGKVGVGNPVAFIFDAYPDLAVAGEVLRLEPTLATIEGTPYAVAWASVEAGSDLVLLSGMAAEVEVVAGESLDTLLVPVQALRELSPGSYAVFVVQPDGQLKLRPVTVGLKDFATAEILDGLEAGEVVSTGSVETK